MTDDDKIRRARAWQALYDEEGGLRDMLTHIHTDMLEGMAQALPWEVAKLANLKLAGDVATKLHAAIQRVLDDGKIAKHSADFINEVADIPNFRQRWGQ